MNASRWLFAGLAGLVALLFAGSLAVGPEMFPLPVALRDIAAGTNSIAAIVLVEIRLPRAVLGLFDPPARGCVKPHLLNFSVPWPKLLAMIDNMDDCFLNTYIWEGIRKRMASAQEK